MLGLLRQNPGVALPTILPRLEQKAAEWAENKVEMMGSLAADLQGQLPEVA